MNRHRVSSKKANFKDSKYGFGGRKKRSKYNTAESHADAFNKESGRDSKTKRKFVNKQGGGGGKAGKAAKGGAKRPVVKGKAGKKFASNGNSSAKKFENKNKPKRKFK